MCKPSFGAKAVRIINLFLTTYFLQPVKDGCQVAPCVRLSIVSTEQQTQGAYRRWMGINRHGQSSRAVF